VSDEKKTPTAGPAEVKFDYIKSNFFRVVHADGAIGGPTPNGNIQMNLWSQRAPIPTHVVYQMSGGVIGNEVEREQRDAIVREVEAGIVLDLPTAISVRDWLDRQIQSLSALASREEGTQQ